MPPPKVARVLPATALSRRAALFGTAALAAAPSARAFGEAGAFSPRLLRTGGQALTGPRAEAPGRWAWELIRRTSAPARLAVRVVAADQPELLSEPFCVWAGSERVEPLTAPEVRGLQRFFGLGGVLLVDDSVPESGAFGKSARYELSRVLPASAPVALDSSHVIYKAYYMLDRPVGRVAGQKTTEAILQGKTAHVLLLSQDLLGALAPSPGGGWALSVEPGGFRQREYAVRFAVNLAMYVLCSDYKDDQVHAPWLMRRRMRADP